MSLQKDKVLPHELGQRLARHMAHMVDRPLRGRLGTMLLTGLWFAVDAAGDNDHATGSDTYSTMQVIVRGAPHVRVPSAATTGARNPMCVGCLAGLRLHFASFERDLQHREFFGRRAHVHGPSTFYFPDKPPPSSDPNANRSTSVRITPRPVLGLTLVVVIAAALWAMSDYSLTVTLYGAVLFPILALKIGSSWIPRASPAGPPAHSIAAVVTLYNEDPHLLRLCVESLRRQTVAPTAIVVVDDASTDRAAVEWATAQPDVQLLQQPVNRGKRWAIRRGYEWMRDNAPAGVLVYLDSDAALEPDALARGLIEFNNPDVGAATGVILPSNYEATLLTRLVDVRYLNSFIVERAAYSHLGAMLCVCGALAFYRAEQMDKHLDTLTSQTFMGAEAVVGDDRHMTNLILADGQRAVVNTRSIGHTAVPEKFGHYVRQQARWGRSFFRESWWMLTNGSPKRPAWWLSAIEVVQQAAFTSMLLFTLVVAPLLTGSFLLLDYLAIVAVMSLVRSVRYFDLGRPDQTLGSRLYTFALVPLYGFFNLFVLLPLRMWSLATLKRAAWGTRAVVEVRA